MELRAARGGAASARTEERVQGRSLMRFPLFARTGVGRGLALAIFGLVLAVSWSGTAGAQEVKKLRVAVGRSAVLTLPDSIGTVSIADDKIADVVVATPYQVLIIGKI